MDGLDKQTIDEESIPPAVAKSSSLRRSKAEREASAPLFADLLNNSLANTASEPLRPARRDVQKSPTQPQSRQARADGRIPPSEWKSKQENRKRRKCSSAEAATPHEQEVPEKSLPAPVEAVQQVAGVGDSARVKKKRKMCAAADVEHTPDALPSDHDVSKVG